MDACWHSRIANTCARADETQEAEFLQLVSQAADHVDDATARTLLSTFSAKPDFGTQERVISVLQSADPEIYLQALLLEAERLKNAAPEWAITLLGWAVLVWPSVLQRLLVCDPSRSTAAFAVIRSSEFLDFYPEAKSIAAAA